MHATIHTISQGTLDDIFDNFVDSRIKNDPVPLVWSEIVWSLIYANRRGELADLANNEEFVEALYWNIESAKANADALLNA